MYSCKLVDQTLWTTLIAIRGNLLGSLVFTLRHVRRKSWINLHKPNECTNQKTQVLVCHIYLFPRSAAGLGITLNPVGTRQQRSGLLSAGRHASSMHGQYSIQRIIIIISRGYIHLLTPPSHPDPDTLVAIHSLAYCQQFYPQMEIKSWVAVVLMQHFVE